MANLSVYNSEMIFLREAVLQKYCADINENLNAFTGKLTGTLKYYEDMTEVITDYIQEEKTIPSYARLLKESPFKMILQKWIAESNKLRHQRSEVNEPAVSANILRKLIFYGPSNAELSFKDYFILACYIYIGKDRSVILKQLPAGGVAVRKTLPPADIAIDPSDSGVTIPPFEKKVTCSLTPLNGNDKPTKLTFHFTGNDIVINRDNLDPGNFTITSKVQAKLSFADGQWQIENQSALKTTYIQVIKPFQLENGDIILLGNKHFLFTDSES